MTTTVPSDKFRVWSRGDDCCCSQTEKGNGLMLSPAPCSGKCPGSDSPAFFDVSKITQLNPKCQTGALWYLNSSPDLGILDCMGATLAIWDLKKLMAALGHARKISTTAVFQVEATYVRPLWIKIQWWRYSCVSAEMYSQVGKNNPRLETGLQFPWPFTTGMLQHHFGKKLWRKIFTPTNQSPPKPHLFQIKPKKVSNKG